MLADAQARVRQHLRALFPADQVIADAEGGVHHVQAVGVRHRLDAAQAGQRFVLELEQGALVLLAFDLVERQHRGAGEQQQAEQAQQLEADAEARAARGGHPAP